MPLPSCSIIVPCLNEAGNIAAIIDRTPCMGAFTELIFVDGHSTDGTQAAIDTWMARYTGSVQIQWITQQGQGKADAVRCGFTLAHGDIVMILDADLTVVPEDLPMFYQAIQHYGGLVIGTRMVRPMEAHAMRFLNRWGNRVFALLCSLITHQRITDALCGTKVLWRKDVSRMLPAQSVDPFGDFDLLFGAARCQLFITELPVGYARRRYGVTKIHRFRQGWILFYTCLHAWMTR